MTKRIGKLGMVALLAAVAMQAGAAAPAGQHDAISGAQRHHAWLQLAQAQPVFGYGNDNGRSGRHGGRGERNARDDSDQYRDQRQRSDGYQQDGGRRGTRMSPEERRELRRQIDEAGRNIYAPRR